MREGNFFIQRVTLSQSLIKSKDVHAGNVIKVLAPIVSGRGGGKPDMAMAGGSDANGIQDLLSAVAEQL